MNDEDDAKEGGDDGKEMTGDGDHMEEPVEGLDDEAEQLPSEPEPRGQSALSSSGQDFGGLIVFACTGLYIRIERKQETSNTVPTDFASDRFGWQDDQAPLQQEKSPTPTPAATPCEAPRCFML